MTTRLSTEVPSEHAPQAAGADDSSRLEPEKTFPVLRVSLLGKLYEQLASQLLHADPVDAQLGAFQLACVWTLESRGLRLLPILRDVRMRSDVDGFKLLRGNVFYDTARNTLIELVVGFAVSSDVAGFPGMGDRAFFWAEVRGPSNAAGWPEMPAPQLASQCRLAGTRLVTFTTPTVRHLDKAREALIQAMLTQFAAITQLQVALELADGLEHALAH